MIRWGRIGQDRTVPQRIAYESGGLDETRPFRTEWNRMRQDINGQDSII